MTDNNMRIDLEAGLDPSSWARMVRAAEDQVRTLKQRMDRVMQGGDILGGTGGSVHSARHPSYSPSGIQPASRYGGFTGYLGRQLLGRGSAEGATARLVAGVMGFGGGMMSLPGQIIGGVGTARRQEQDLSNLNRRVGESLATYSRFRTEVLATGEALGNTRQQIIQMTNDYVSSVGRMNTTKLGADLTYGQTLAKGLGVAPELITGAFGGLSRNMQGPATNTTMLGQTIASAIDTGGMRGRESEVVKAIEDLTDLMGQRIPTITPVMFQSMAGLMTAFNATGIQGLMGSRGEQVIGGLNQFASGNQGALRQNLLFRAMQTASGQRLSIPEMTRAMQQGLASPLTGNAMKSLFSAFPQDKSGWNTYLLSKTMNMSMEQIDAMRGGLANWKPGQPLPTTALGTNVQLTAQDQATKALVDFQNSLLNVATTLMPEVTNALHAVTNVVNGAGGVLASLMGLAGAAHLAELGVYAITALQIAGAARGGMNFVGGIGQVPMQGPVKPGQTLGTGFSARAARGMAIKGGLVAGGLMTGVNVLGDLATGQDPWRDIGRGIFTTAGGIGGGLLGSLLGPLGTIGGGIAGGYAGNAAFDWLFPDKGAASSPTMGGQNPTDLLASIDQNIQIMTNAVGGRATSVGGVGAVGNGPGFGFSYGSIGAGAGITHGLSAIFGHGITQGYGHTAFEGFHTGVDLDYKAGTAFSLPFLSKVLATTGHGLGPDIGGNEMLLQGPGGKEILLAHLQRFIAQVGQTVGAGGTIALTGNSGQSSGPHLHLQVMNPGSGSWGSRSIDPIQYLQNLSGSVDVNIAMPDGSTHHAKATISSGPYKGIVPRTYGYGSN